MSEFINWIVLFMVAFIIIFLLWSLINQAVEYSVYGPYLPDQTLGHYFERSLSLYEVNEFGSEKSKLLYSRDYRFPLIGQTTSGDWYIRGYGRIPSHSKYNKTLNDLWESKTPENNDEKETISR